MSHRDKISKLVDVFQAASETLKSAFARQSLLQEGLEEELRLEKAATARAIEEGKILELKESTRKLEMLIPRLEENSNKMRKIRLESEKLREIEEQVVETLEIEIALLEKKAEEGSTPQALDSKAQKIVMTSETAKLELRDILDELQAKVDRDALRLEALCKELDDVLAAKGRAEEQGLDLAVIWLNVRMDLVTERLRVFKDRWHKKVEKVMELKEMFKARFGDDFATEAANDPA